MGTFPGKFLSSRTLYSLVLSVLLHLTLLSRYRAASLSEPIKPPRETFTVERVDSSTLKKYRTVGIKDGVQEFSLQSLRSQSLGEVVSPNISNPVPKKKLPQGPRVSIRRNDEHHFVRDLSKRYSNNVIRNAGFNVNFKPPKGVSEDQLNTVEKKFWSFKKRVYTVYISSFSRTYNDLMLANPRLKGQVTKGNHKLKGSVTFDGKGNLLKISITKSTNSDDIHSLFEETLKTMQKIPNPPHEITEGKNFTIYYVLTINNR